MKTLLSLYFAIGIALFVGWVLNIVHVVHAIGGPFTTKLGVELVGIFAFPLGAILGYVA
jgi:hypothetical protein